MTTYCTLKIKIPTTHELYPLRHLVNPISGPIRKSYYKKWARIYNKVLTEYNLPKISSLYEAFKGDHTIIADYPEIIPLNVTDENVHVVGALVMNEMNATPRWLKKIDKDVKVMYLSLSSTGTSYDRILKILIKLFGDNPKYVIISNYTELLKDKTITVPNNFYLEKFLPAKPILQRADLMINHGGSGVMYHAIKNMVPSLSIPHQAEQEWNSELMKKKGLGEYIYRKDISISQLKRKINLLLNSNTYKTNLERTRAQIIKYTPIEDSIKIIEDYLDDKYIFLDDGTRIYYDFQNTNREKVVLLHGWMCSTENYKFNQGAVNEKYDTLVFDFYGNGKSDKYNGVYSIEIYANLFEEVLKKLGIKEFYLMGQSMGSIIANRYFEKHPENVKKLILIDPPTNKQAKPLKILLPLLKALRSTRLLKNLISKVKSSGKFHSYWTGWLISKNSKHQAACDITIKAMLKSQDQMIIDGLIDTLADRMLLRHNPEKSDKVYVVYGEFDPVNSKADITNIAFRKNIYMIPDSHHTPNRTKPDEFNQVLLKILNDN
jgi:pimeloyl-ACP methyl ester carboxylesterase